MAQDRPGLGRLEIHQLGSGSGGNATLLRGSGAALLVDAGFSAREILRRAAACGVPAAQIEGIVLSHGHADHSRGAPVLARRLGVPIWATEPTLRNLPGLRGGERLQPLPCGQPVTVAGFLCEAQKVSHDLPGTVILKFDRRVGVATDLGMADQRVRRFLAGLEVLLLEFNHDLRLLAGGSYPPWLKRRIRSEVGHLSNDQATLLLAARGFVRPSRALVVCHLSEENNRPALALAAARRGLLGGDTKIVLTGQDQLTRVVVPAANHKEESQTAASGEILTTSVLVKSRPQSRR